MNQKSILKLAQIEKPAQNHTIKRQNVKKPDPKPAAKPIQTQQKTEKEMFKRFKYTPTELQAKIDEYFKQGGTVREIIVGSGSNRQIKEMRIFTLTGLCLYAGFCDKTELFDLERNPSYKATIKKARSRMEKIYEENLQVTGNSANIFALKNFGWTDQQTIVTEDKRLKIDL